MKRELANAEVQAEAIMNRLKAASTHEEIAFLVREYVKTRFFLEDEDLALETFNALGQMSIARTTGMDPTEVITADLSVRCDGASSSFTKKILLLIALNRELGLGISPEESVQITTLGNLIDRVSAVVLAHPEGN